MRTSFVFTGVFLAATVAQAIGGQIVVNPGGGGNYTDLQPAIDAASSGDVILLVGGCYHGIVINKSLSIVGSGKIVRTTASCDNPFWGSGNTDSCSGFACSALRIAGPATKVTLAGLTIQGQWDANLDDSDADPTILCAPGVDLRLYDCSVTGPTGVQASGIAVTTSAAIYASGCSLTLVRSHVTGGEHVFDGSLDDSSFWHWLVEANGPPAIVAKDVTLLDSTVIGGTQGNYDMQPSDSNCPPPWPSGVNPAFGHGGAGIVATRVYRAGGSLVGGPGTTITEACSGPATIYNQQLAGAACQCTTYVVLANDLATSGAPHLGANWSVNASGAGGFLMIGTVKPLPIAAGVHGLLFVLPPVSFPLIPGSALAAIVPSNAQLVGVEFGVQWLSPNGVLSRPVFEAIRP